MIGFQPHELKLYVGRIVVTEPTAKCSVCGRVIRQLTADRRNGMCAPCHRNAARPPEERFANEVFDTIEATIKPFTGYKEGSPEATNLASRILAVLCVPACSC